ncbi:EamA-like transporter family protein [compost metagenome]
MSVFTNLSTLVSIAAGALFLGEEVTLYHWIGSALIIAGVVGANMFGRGQTVEACENSGNGAHSSKHI